MSIKDIVSPKLGTYCLGVLLKKNFSKLFLPRHVQKSLILFSLELCICLTIECSKREEVDLNREEKLFLQLGRVQKLSFISTLFAFIEYLCLALLTLTLEIARPAVRVSAVCATKTETGGNIFADLMQNFAQIIIYVKIESYNGKYCVGKGQDGFVLYLFPFHMHSEWQLQRFHNIDKSKVQVPKKSRDFG